MCLTGIKVKTMVSQHYKKKRSNRENFIRKHFGGDGKVIDSFLVNNGHKDGIERHEVTDKGIIVIYNAASGKLVTKKIGRERQIRRLYENAGKKPPKYLIELAQWHNDLRYNSI